MGELVDLGHSSKTGEDLFGLLPFFLPGTYDIILKNCNAFTDCAIHYLLGLRLCEECTLLEHAISRNVDMFEKLTLGYYTRNPKASRFSHEDVIAFFASLPRDDDVEEEILDWPPDSITSREDSLKASGHRFSEQWNHSYDCTSEL